MKTTKPSLLEQAAKLAVTKPAVTRTVISEQDRVYQQALSQVMGSQSVNEADEQQAATPTTAMNDKGMFGNRQIDFVQEVYHIPESPANDQTQPTGLLTLKDLNHYCVFRKGDKLTFKYVSGDAGNCQYEAKKSGQETFTREFKWSDGLIQELIDEGACNLI